MKRTKGISGWFTPSISENEAYEYWREKVFLIINFIFVVVGGVTYIFSAYLSFLSKVWSVLVIDTLVYLSVVLIFMLRELPYKVRAYIIAGITYITGLTMLIILGTIGAGPIWLFAFPIITVLILDLKCGIAALILNFVTLGVVAYLMYIRALNWNFMVDNTYQAWLVDTVNFILLDSIITVSSGLLMQGLKKHILNEKEITSTLNREKAKLHSSLEQQYREMDQRVKTETALRQSESNYRYLVENLPFGIYRSDPEGLILYANTALAAILGYDDESRLIGNTNINNFFSIGSNRAELFQNLINEFSHTHEVELTDCNGNVKIVRESIRVSVSADKWEVEGIIENITERKKHLKHIEELNRELEDRVSQRTMQLQNTLKNLQEEINIRVKSEFQLRKVQYDLIQALNKEKDLSELKSRFITMVSHEYRTPLTVILSSAFLIEKVLETLGISNEKIARALSKTKVSVRNMTEMLEDVIAVGYDSKQIVSMNIAQVDIGKFLNSIAGDMMVINDESRRIAINGTDEGRQPVYTDIKMLRSVFTNLISNAIKYSIIDTDIVIDVMHNDDSVSISISNKIGNRDSIDLGMIFDSFYRGGNVGTSSGSGLGLAIVKKYVDAFGGTITVNVDDRPVITFTVSLPLNGNLNRELFPQETA